MSEKRVRYFSWLCCACAIFALTFNVHTEFGGNEKILTVQLPKATPQEVVGYSEIRDFVFAPVAVKRERDETMVTPEEVCPLKFSLITPSEYTDTTHLMLTNTHTKKFYWVREGDLLEEGKGRVLELMKVKQHNYELRVDYDNKEYRLKLQDAK